MKVLVFGASGMLGHKLVQVFCNDSSLEVYGTVRGGVKGLRGEKAKIFTGVNVTDDFEFVRGIIYGLRPEVVVNAVGIVKQSSEAKQVEKSLEMNSVFPHKLYEVTRAVGGRLITISTDCVFKGDRGNYKEEDPADAEDLYGRSKLLGEVVGQNCLTIRTSIIGRELKGCKGLVEWFLSQRGKSVKGYKRAIFSGFPTVILAEVIRDVIKRYPSLDGLYHVSSEPISKYDLLCLIKEKLGLEICIELDEEVVVNRSLDSTKFRKATGFSSMSWERMVERMLEDFQWYERVRNESNYFFWD